MSRFRDLSIRSKLMTGFMLTSLAALRLTLGALAAYDRVTFRDEVLRDVDTLAGIIGENASSSVAFNGRQTAALKTKNGGPAPLAPDTNSMPGA